MVQSKTPSLFFFPPRPTRAVIFEWKRLFPWIQHNDVLWICCTVCVLYLVFLLYVFIFLFGFFFVQDKDPLMFKCLAPAEQTDFSAMPIQCLFWEFFWLGWFFSSMSRTWHFFHCTGFHWSVTSSLVDHENKMATW